MSKKISFRAGPTPPPTRFWNMAEVDGDTAEITMYGDVVSAQPVDWWTGEPLAGQYISPEGFAEDLAVIKDKKVVNIKINSLGGDVYTALAIHNALKELPAQKNVIVEGVAASAASVIAMAGDTVKMYPGSIMMIHGVSAFFCDYFQIGDLKKVVKAMDASERAIAAIYSVKTGTEESAIRSMMEKECWMTGAEAVSKGFADEVLTGDGPNMQMSASGRMLIVNGIHHNTDGLHIPDRFNIPQLSPTAPAVEDKIQTKGDAKPMTIEELRAQYPNEIAQIEQEAVAADRARIQEIEEIQDSIGDAEMIAAAKFTAPTNAAALALQAMKKQAKLGNDFLTNRAQETAPANQVTAEPPKTDDPAIIAKEQKEAEKAELANIAKLYNEIYK